MCKAAASTHKPLKLHPSSSNLPHTSTPHPIPSPTLLQYPPPPPQEELLQYQTTNPDHSPHPTPPPLQYPPEELPQYQTTSQHLRDRDTWLVERVTAEVRAVYGQALDDLDWDVRKFQTAWTVK